MNLAVWFTFEPRLFSCWCDITQTNTVANSRLLCAKFMLSPQQIRSI